MTLRNKISILLCATLLISSRCKREKPGPEEPDTTFPKQEMLVNMADQVIAPAYFNFAISLDSLSGAYSGFQSGPATQSLNDLRHKLHAAYLKYQYISIFGFGPADDEAIRVNFNVFPCDTNLINKNISTGSYNLSSAANVAAKGFPALDYLLNGYKMSDQQIVTLFSSSSRKKYVSDLLAEMSTKTNKIQSDWLAYKGTFVNTLGTDVSSSIGFLVNQLNFELDYLKNSKFGIPLGLKSDGRTLPHYAESYYGGFSKEYAIETLKTIGKLYKGENSQGTNGLGFDDYLDHLGATRGSENLNAAIQNQFTSAQQKLDLLSGPIAELIVTHPSSVNAAYMELVKLLVLLKTDLPSQLGVVITYQDGDGD